VSLREKPAHGKTRLGNIFLIYYIFGDGGQSAHHPALNMPKFFWVNWILKKRRALRAMLLNKLNAKLEYYRRCKSEVEIREKHLAR